MKASGFGRLDFDPLEALQKIHEVAVWLAVWGEEEKECRKIGGKAKKNKKKMKNH